MNINPALTDPFWDQVLITPTCWLWQGRKNKKKDGYGLFWHEKKQWLAHRLVLSHIPDGLCVLHKCDTPACVNPDHLFLGTKADNARDAVSKNRDSAFRRAKLTPQAVEELRAMPRTMEVARAAAEKYGVSMSSINQVQNHHTWKRVDTGPKPYFERIAPHGEDSSNAKLSSEDVQAIRRAPRGHGSASALARHYSVSVGAIQMIRCGTNWAHLPWEEGVSPHVARHLVSPPPPRQRRKRRVIPSHIRP